MKYVGNVTLEASAELLTVRVLGEYMEGAEFAFYLYRDGERIRTRWYKTEPTWELTEEIQPGYYFATVYVRIADSKTVTIKSNPEFINPELVTVKNISKMASNTRAYLYKGKHWDFPVLFYPNSESKRLFVILSAAVNREKQKLPVFNRMTWAQKGIFPGSVLCISDPTIELSDSMRLGWYIGDEKKDLLDDLSQFILAYAKTYGIANRDIVFWGSSAGGFAALALSAKVKGSSAVTINAQVDALSYEIRSAVEEVRRVCFDNKSENAIRSKYSRRVNMRKAWRGAKSRAILVQNKLDHHHYDVHFSPFWREMRGKFVDGWSKSGRNLSWVYEDKRGHAAETPEMVDEILKRLFT